MRTRKEIAEHVSRDINADFGGTSIWIAYGQLEVLLDIRDIVEGIDRRMGAKAITKKKKK